MNIHAFVFVPAKEHAATQHSRLRNGWWASLRRLPEPNAFKLHPGSGFSRDQALQVQGQGFAEQESFQSLVSLAPSYREEPSLPSFPFLPDPCECKLETELSPCAVWQCRVHTTACFTLLCKNLPVLHGEWRHVRTQVFGRCRGSLPLHVH